MGYLTTFTIYNDGCDLVKKHPEKFAEEIYNGCLGVHSRDGRSSDSFGLGYHANLVTVQKPRHADDETVYVHSGNTVVEFNTGSKDFIDLYKRNPSYVKRMLKVLQTEVDNMKQIIKADKDMEIGP